MKNPYSKMNCISVNPDRFLSINEIKDLLNNGTIPKDCIDTRFKRFKKKIKSLLGLEKKNKIDYHIIIMSYDESIDHYIDIKILPDLYDAMMYCDELSDYKLNVFLYSITNGNGRTLEELNIRFTFHKLMHLIALYRLWRKGRAAKLVETFKRDEVLLRARLKELPDTISDWKICICKIYPNYIL